MYHTIVENQRTLDSRRNLCSIDCGDLPNRAVKQWPSLGIKAKNGKSATTYLLDIPDLLAGVTQWDTFIRAQLPGTAPWYAPITHTWGDQSLSQDAPGKNRNIALGKRLRKLFALAELPHHSPHKFRHGHAVFALQPANTMADFKAVSMNLMHSDIRVTDGIYAPLTRDEVKQRIASLIGSTQNQTVNGQAGQFIHRLTDDDLLSALTQRLKGGVP